MDYFNQAWTALTGSWNYFVAQITQPSWTNYFYWLLGLSLLVWLLEIVWPWRKEQKVIRKDFWLDGFYMFFNYFFFYMIGFAALSSITENLFNDFLGMFSIENRIAQWVDLLPNWGQLLLYFVLVDFVHWNIHRLLHKSKFLWQFHKVHHSVREMGFAAHLRYHWMENIMYKSITYMPLAIIGGFSIDHLFIVHMIQTGIGHLNHANFVIPLGPLKYIFNTSSMHIWHHAKELPKGKYGVNFGLSLSVWDYLFGTNYIPKSGRDIALGFDGVEEFPEDFIRQQGYPLTESRKESVKNS